MKNPFTEFSEASLAHWLRVDGMDDKEAAYASHAINQHERMRELLQLAYDVIEDDLEERPARHSLGHLAARIRVLLAEEKEDEESI